MRTFLLFIIFCFSITLSNAQQSLARQWNEVLLEAIRNDFSRPTVHARNLFHISAAMYDAWAISNAKGVPYFLGQEINGYEIDFEGFESQNPDIIETENEAISYAAYRLIIHRFSRAADTDYINSISTELFTQLGFDHTFTDADYRTGNPAALGNYIAQEVIKYGLQDGANEVNDYANLYYEPKNQPIAPGNFGNADMEDYNRWQPIRFLESYVDQAGNILSPGVAHFLSPEWGNVTPFSLQESDAKILQRDSQNYKVYYDPGPPPLFEDTTTINGLNDYTWNFLTVLSWSSHLDPSDGIMIDISPSAKGNIQDYPETPEGLREFYNFIDGGDPSLGRESNPITGQAYEPNQVLRGDYTRVVAEYWADGPESETPPGHWYVIMNEVMDHPLFERKFKGQGEELSLLEYDIKAYFILGATMHDCAITAWSIKGYYDYPRPVSVLRLLDELGQSSDSLLPNYHPNGIPLQGGLVELIDNSDFGQYIPPSTFYLDKIKVRSWAGPKFVRDPETDFAGVHWISLDSWWPYQRPSFISPPFAGYLSGHSTFSSAAAEILTILTGDPFFPGGMGEFVAKQNEFLVFEDGPSEDVTLQWATYKDASDETSLSRIWGGIHPPIDDMPGRSIGNSIGKTAFQKAEIYFREMSTAVNDVAVTVENFITPNPVSMSQKINFNPDIISAGSIFTLYSIDGTEILNSRTKSDMTVSLDGVLPGTYIATLQSDSGIITQKLAVY